MATLERSPILPRRRSDSTCDTVRTAATYRLLDDLPAVLLFAGMRYRTAARQLIKSGGSPAGIAFWRQCEQEARQARVIVMMSPTEAYAVRRLERAGLDWIADALRAGPASWPSTFGDW